MAAQAVDFTLSGHVNRALFVTDADAGTNAQVSDNGGSGTRFRMNGSAEVMDGNTVGIQFEYGAGSTVSLRHANVQYGGAFGRVTVGQGSEAGDGSAYSDTTEVFGIGHGAGTPSDFTLGDYFGSLDAGGRVEMIRYDTPSVGPVSAAVSMGNGDRVSAQIKVSTEVAGSTFGAKVATLQMPGDTSSIGASFGATLASGLTVSGAWGKGKDHAGAMTAAVAAVPGTPAMPAMFRYVNTASTATTNIQLWNTDNSGTLATATDSTFDEIAANAQALIAAVETAGDAATEQQKAAAAQAEERLKAIFDEDAFNCDPAPDVIGDAATADCSQRLYSHAMDEIAGTDGMDAMQTYSDPNYFQVEIGYKFGNTGVAASWWQGNDFYMDGSKSTAIGIGARHTMPKAGAQIYAAVQNYDVTPMEGAESMDETVFVVGTLVKF